MAVSPQVSTPTDEPQLPFAVNCRLSKTFFGMPRKCCKCQRMIVFTAGYACQFCSFRCHRKCAGDTDDQSSMSGSIADGASSPTFSQLSASGPPIRRRMCSLSRLPSSADCESATGSKLFLPNGEAGTHSAADQVAELFPEQWWAWTNPGSGACSPNESGCSALSAPENSLHDMFSLSCESVQTLTSGEANSPITKDMPDSPGLPVSDPDSHNALSHQDTLTVPDVNDNMVPNDDSVMSRLLRLWPWSREPTITAEQPQTTLPTAATVDSFNKQVLERLLQNKQSTASSVATSTSLADSAISSCGDAAALSTLSVTHWRRMNWVNFVVGDRHAHSQDCESVQSNCTPVLSRAHVASRAMSPNGSAIGTRGKQNPHRSLGGSRSNLWPPLDENDPILNRSSSWPILGLHINFGQFHSDADALCSGEEEDDQPDSGNVPDAGFSIKVDSNLAKAGDPPTAPVRVIDLNEWAIPFSDLRFGDCIYRGTSVATYRGKWHGEVMIHRYDESHLERFLRDVHTLTKIRHENIALFVGACMEPPNLAVVTSIRKRERLYEAIYERKRALQYNQKMIIARQIAQGIGYLHGKGIVLRCLTSKGIFIDGHVKISTIDYGGPCTSSWQPKTRGGCLMCRHQLTCISPELMRTLRIDVAVKLDSRVQQKSTDVYSFGTILYELFAARVPFAHLPADSIIWRIGSGQSDSTDKLQCHVALKSLIEDCWSHDANYRPVIREVLQQLVHTVNCFGVYFVRGPSTMLTRLQSDTESQSHNSETHTCCTVLQESAQKRHSTSEPEALNKVGIPKRSTLPVIHSSQACYPPSMAL